MRLLKHLLFWPVAIAGTLVVLSAILGTALDYVVRVAFIVEVAAIMTYAAIACLRRAARPHSSRPYRRPGIGERQAQEQQVIRVVGEVVDDGEYGQPLRLRPHTERRRLSAARRLALPAPKE